MQAPEPVQAPGVRSRLLARVRPSAARAQAMHTRRHIDTAPARPAGGVAVHTLYAAAGGGTLRPGEPQRTQLVSLAAGAAWTAPEAPGLRREWLVLEGALSIDDAAFAALDFLLQPAGAPAPRLASAAGALLLLREAPAAAADAPCVQPAAGAAWADFAPGIERRLLWQHAGEAAMLYRTAPGAAVPRHGHRHDEECLMLRGELFLDDVLLLPLDYQLAPAGSEHQGVATETGVLLYAHGDLELDLQPG